MHGRRPDGGEPVNLLDLLIAIPAIGFILTLLIPRAQEQAIRMFTLGVSLLTFVLSLGLATGYQTGQPGQQFVTDTVWIANPEIHWHVGIDGLSLWLIILSTFLTPIAILISWRSIKDRTQRVLRLPAAARIRPGRRLRGVGSVPVLRVLGSRSRARCTS